MSENVAEAEQQDQLAEALMNGPTLEAEPVDNAGAESAVEEEAIEQSTAQEVEQEETSDWLPSEQEKVFPDDVLEQYAAKRYPKILAMVKADPGNAELRQLLHDKLNTDIHLRDQQSRQEFEEQENEEAEARQEPTQPQQITFEQHLQNVQRIADQVTDPQMASAFASQFLQAFGVKEAPSPEVAQQLTRTMTTFGLNLMNTVLPQMLNAPMGNDKTFIQSLIEQHYEGFGETHEQTTYERAWQKALSSDPRFQSLPGFRDKGSDELRIKAAEKYAGSVEDFEAIQFKGKDGKALSPYQNAVKKYSVLARIMAGEKVSPAEAAKFVQAGKKAERRSQLSRSAGNVSSGKSNQQISSSSNGFETNNDLFDGEALGLYKQQHGRL